MSLDTSFPNVPRQPRTRGLHTPAALIAAAFAVGCAGGAGRSGEAAPAPPSGGAPTLAYVTIQDGAQVAVIDLDRRTLDHVVDLRELGFGENAKPHHVAVEPDGSAWYLSLIGAGKVLKLDRNDQVVAQADMETPGMMALDPERDLLVVGRSMTAVNAPPRVAVIETATMQAEEVDVLVARPHAVALEPTGGMAYAGSLGADQFAVLNLETQEVQVEDVAPPEASAGQQHAMHMLVHFDISPDGRTLASTAEMTDQVLVFDLTDPSSPELVESVPVGDRPWHPAFSPDGSRLYVPNKGESSVTVLDTGDWSRVGTIRGTGLAEPHGAAVSPDGRTLVVTSNNLTGTYVSRESGSGPSPGTVVLVDTESRLIEEVIEVGPNPTGVGVAAPMR